MGWLQWFAKAVYTVVKEMAKEAIRDLADYVIRELPRKVADWWNGKKIAVIGPTAVGKNCLYQRLKGESIPDEHIQTRGVERVAPFVFQRKLADGTEFKIHCKRSVNIGGERDERDRFWMDACQGADVIFYMITLDDLRDGRFKQGDRIYEDLQWMAGVIGECEPHTVVHFLVNKIDKELTDGAGYEAFVSGLAPVISEFEKTAKSVFGPYRTRLTGVSPTSMRSDHIFAVSFPLALKAIHGAVTRKSRKVTVDSAASRPVRRRGRRRGRPAQTAYGSSSRRGSAS